MQVRLTIPEGTYQIGFHVMFINLIDADILGMLFDISVKTGACLDICMYAQFIW